MLLKKKKIIQRTNRGQHLEGLWLWKGTPHFGARLILGRNNMAGKIFLYIVTTNPSHLHLLTLGALPKITRVLLTTLKQQYKSIYRTHEQKYVIFYFWYGLLQNSKIIPFQWKMKEMFFNKTFQTNQKAFFNCRTNSKYTIHKEVQWS